MTTTTSIPAASNPFLEQIEHTLTTTEDDLQKQLNVTPLSGLDIKSLSKEARYDLLDRMSLELFVPSQTALNSTRRLYKMIRKGYLARNPTTPEFRRRSITLSRFAGAELQNLPWLPGFALGMRTIGITGLGKTYETRRAQAQLPSCIEHGRSDAADWTHFYQAPILYIGMSFDGSIGGLLLQILIALDNAIFTDYSQQKRLTGLSNEKLAVQVAIILANHAVGALIIDEIQDSNFNDGSRGTLARTFFLRLLNFGIPILLIGNPMGMRFIDTFSQDIRRLSSCGTMDLHPFERDHPNYTDVLAPSFWRYNVMPEAPRISDPDGQILFRYCGGIRDFAVRIIAAAQRIALDLDEKSVAQEHLDIAFNGEDFSDKERTIIKAFCKKDACLLQSFSDIPWEDYFRRWNPTNESEAQPSPSEKKAEDSAEKTGPSCAQQTAKAMIAKRTRDKNKQGSIEKTKTGLREDDLRAQGIQQHLVTSLAEAVKEGFE